MSRVRMLAVVTALAVGGFGDAHGAVLNGTFSVVLPASGAVGFIADLPSITDLSLTSNVPQTIDLFDLFSTAPVTAQPISVQFNLTQSDVGAFSGTVNGEISAAAGADDPGFAAFTPLVVPLPTIGSLSLDLSSAGFGNDFNGTVLATLTEAVPEPSALALLGASLAASIGAGRRYGRKAR